MTELDSAGSPTAPRAWLGVDTGGTFTDFVFFDGATLRVHKVLSTPDAPERAILQGVRELGLDVEGLRVVHGSTVATNAVLEGKGVRTAYIANAGLADVLTIGRQARRDLYDLQPAPVAPPVPAELCLEIDARTGAEGVEIAPLTSADLERLCAAVEDLTPRAVAINLLFSFLDAGHERAIEAALRTALPDLFIARSSNVLPEYREYERGMATWLNAYVGPLMQGYLARLEAGLAPARLAVMQSSGNTTEAAQAGARAVHLLLSGPAGGLMGAAYLGRLCGRDKLLTFDMGGTSTDVALIDGAPRLTSEGHIGHYPVAVPMVDMHTIGAGGGSLAYLDAGGLLQVGPQSAGADPGPACYGRGGDRPTVTDANLILGRLLPDAFLGGAMRLDVTAAEGALAGLADQAGLSVTALATGIVRIANEHMARALRVISVQRGIDPRGYTLMSFGGAGGLHVCALAEALGMHAALVPVQAGVLSALGMLAAPPGRSLSRTFTGVLERMDAAVLEAALAALVAAGEAALIQEGVSRDALHAEASLDLRYQGQSFTLNIPWQTPAAASAAFHAAHEQRYGHCLPLPVELVNLRVELRGAAPDLLLATQAVGAAAAGPTRHTRVHGCGEPVPVYARERLAAGQTLSGPALITETVATTWLAPAWRAVVDDYGNLSLTRLS